MTKDGMQQLSCSLEWVITEELLDFLGLAGTTPNLDRLSNEGIHFDNAFTIFSTCSPSRATMLTGVYPHIHGVTDNSTAFPIDSTTYASLLKGTVTLPVILGNGITANNRNGLVLIQ